MIGDKRYTEALDDQFIDRGRGAFPLHRSRRVTDGGVMGSEYADMSSDKTG